MIEGISHITLVVRDIERTAELFIKLFDARETYSSGEATHSISKEKFLLINGIWIAIIEGDPIKEKTYNHIAFKIDSADLDGYSERIAGLGLEIKQDRKRAAEEGRSIYFYDYDNHLFELHTGMLEERLRYYR
jgi:catechol 2,3-dioxygenase-like lactoylglutathione lyase family enzyme